MWFVGGWFYSSLFETFMNGQTPGKRMLSLRVVTVDGEPIDGMQATLRCLFRMLDFMPYIPVIVFVVMFERLTGFSFEYDMGVSTNMTRAIYLVPACGLGLASMMISRRYQRIGDLVAGTVVIVEERISTGGLAKFEDPRTQQLGAILPARLDLNKSTVKALSTYVERRRHFVAERRHEIARHIAVPLLERFKLPADTGYDLLLCALYHRQFIADATDEVLSAPSPFGPSLESPGRTTGQTAAGQTAAGRAPMVQPPTLPAVAPQTTGVGAAPAGGNAAADFMRRLEMQRKAEQNARETP